MTNILASKAVLTNLTVSMWGARTLDKEAAEKVLADNKAAAGAGWFGKRLIVRGRMKEISRYGDGGRVFHNRTTQPWIDGGVRILPVALYQDYIKGIKEHREGFEKAVKNFLKDYPTHVQEAKAELGDLFDEDEYPTVEKLKKSFKFDVVITPCPDSDDFRVALDGADMAQIKADLEARVKSQVDLAVKHAGERLFEHVEKMAEKLKAYKPADKENKKRAESSFRDSMVDNLKKLSDIIPAFNLTNDPALDKIHKRVVKELCDTSADYLREDEVVRKKVQKSAESILKDIKGFMA